MTKVAETAAAHETTPQEGGMRVNARLDGASSQELASC